MSYVDRIKHLFYTPRLRPTKVVTEKYYTEAYSTASFKKEADVSIQLHSKNGLSYVVMQKSNAPRSETCILLSDFLEIAKKLDQRNRLNISTTVIPPNLADLETGEDEA